MRKLIVAALVLLSSCVSSENNMKQRLMDEFGIPDNVITVVEIGTEWCHGCVVAKEELTALTTKLKIPFIYVDSDKLREKWGGKKDAIFVWQYIPHVVILNRDRIYYFGPYRKETVEEEITDLYWAIEELKKNQSNESKGENR